MTAHQRAQAEADEQFARQLQREEEQAAAAASETRRAASAGAGAAAASSTPARASPAYASGGSSSNFLADEKARRDAQLKRVLNSSMTQRLSPDAGDEFAFWMNRQRNTHISHSICISFPHSSHVFSCACCALCVLRPIWSSQSCFHQSECDIERRCAARYSIQLLLGCGLDDGHFPTAADIQTGGYCQRTGEKWEWRSSTAAGALTGAKSTECHTLFCTTAD